MNLETAVHQGESATTRFDTRWDELVRRQRSPNPTLSAAWLRCLAGQAEGLPTVVTVERAGELVGAAALEIVVRRPGVRVARWLGTGPLLMGADFLVDAGVPDVGERLAATVVSLAHVATLGPTPPQGACSSAIRSAAPWATLRQTAGAWTVGLPPPRLDRVRGKAAADARRARRAGVDVSVVTHSAPTDVLAALERLFGLHERRWRGRPDAIPRFGADAGQRAWFREVVAALAMGGDVRLVEVWEDDALAAATLGLLAGTGALFHATAMRSGGVLRRPGHAAMLGWVEAAIDAGATTLRLGGLSGDPAGPKAALGAVEHPRVYVTAATSRAGQQALRAALWARSRARRLQRSRAGRT